MPIKLLTVGRGEALVSAGVEWAPLKKGRVRPRIVVSLRVRDADTGETVTHMASTQRHENIGDALLDMYSNFVHPSMRKFMERPLMEKWCAIINSEEYLMAWKD